MGPSSFEFPTSVDPVDLVGWADGTSVMGTPGVLLIEDMSAPFGGVGEVVRVDKSGKTDGFRPDFLTTVHLLPSTVVTAPDDMAKLIIIIGPYLVMGHGGGTEQYKSRARKLVSERKRGQTAEIVEKRIDICLLDGESSTADSSL